MPKARSAVANVMSPAAAQGTPAYMAGLSAWEVRALTSSYAPSNGKTSMYSTLPAEWQQTGQQHGADNVFNAWGAGGGGDSSGMRLFVHGGGHLDSSNNGIYVYRFGTGSLPIGWEIATNSLSAFADIVINSSNGQYADGKPTAIHVYGGSVWDSTNQRFCRCGGSPYSGGGGGTDIFTYYSFNSSNWGTIGSDTDIGATLGSGLIIKPDGTKWLYLSSVRTPQFINPSTMIATGSGSPTMAGEENGPVYFYDAPRDRYVGFFDSGGSKFVAIVTVDWNANTFTITKTTVLTGTDSADVDDEGLSCFHDTANDEYLAFGGKKSAVAGQISAIYKINPITWAVTKHTLSSPIPMSTSGAGSYGKHVWLPSYRIIGTAQVYNDPAYIIQVP